MAVIVVTVVVQGMMVPAAERGTLKDWRLLVINDGVFQAIGVISFGKLRFAAQTLGVAVQC
jgi:sodium-coupled neutral amino acid transporter 11